MENEIYEIIEENVDKQNSVEPNELASKIFDHVDDVINKKNCIINQQSFDINKLKNELKKCNEFISAMNLLVRGFEK